MAIYYVSATGTGSKNGSAPFDTGGANGPFLITEAFGSSKTPTAGDTVYIINNGNYHLPGTDIVAAATGTNISPLRYVAVDTSLQPVDTRRSSGVLLNESNLARLVLSSNTTLQLTDYTHLYGCHITTSGSTASKPAVNLRQGALVGCKVVSTNTSSSSHAITTSSNNAIIDNCDVFIPQTNNMTAAIVATSPSFTRIHNCIVWNNSSTASTAAISLGAYGVVSNCIIIGSKIGIAGSYGLAGYGYSILNNTFVDIPENHMTYSSNNHAGLWHVSNNIFSSGLTLFNASNATGWIPSVTNYNLYNMIDSTGTRSIAGLNALSESMRVQHTGLFSSHATTGLYLLPHVTGFGYSIHYGDNYGALPSLVRHTRIGIQ
jgi:hypothetical protein